MYMSSPNNRIINNNLQNVLNEKLKRIELKKENLNKNKSARYMDITA